MTYNTNSGSINKEILLNDLELVQDRNTVFFENDDFIVLSPSIQNDSWWFDLLRGNVEKAQQSPKDGLLILRFFDKLLVTPLKKFMDKMVSEEFVVKRQKGKDNWKFNVRLKDGRYIVINQKNSGVEYPMQEVASIGLRGLVDQKIWLDQKEQVHEEIVQLKEQPSVLEKDAQTLIPHIQTYIKSKGFNYPEESVKNLYLSLRSKPFVIISGISGTGKTKIVQLFAESIGATEQNGQFMLISVRPDWSDGSELLGYTDITNNFKEGPLTKLLIHAKDHPERPHFLLLDEMNLARVEYYFSDILSVMESRALTADGYTSTRLGETATGEDLLFPGNLYIIGTVNMDETTHPFSKKVLDRANTLQFNDIDLLNLDFLKESLDEEIEPVQLDNASLEAGYIQISHIYPQHEQLIEEVSKQLKEINDILKTIHAQVGYRVRDEICFYLAHNKDAEMLLSKNEALDFCYMQKILPRIAGSGERVDKVLIDLALVLTEEAFPLCTAKIKEMRERLDYDEFTAFW